MENQIVRKPDVLLQSSELFEFYPSIVEDPSPSQSLTKIPLSRIAALGTAFEPIASAVQKVFSAPGTTNGLYKVTIPSGMHLAEFRSGVGNLGTVLNAENQIAGQAILNPLVCNPTMIFMAAALAGVDKKLEAIQIIQQEMFEFLERKERAEQRANLKFLSSILENYRFNWDNNTFKNSNHIKVLDILQSAEQKIEFYRDQISVRIPDASARKAVLHSDKDAKKRIDSIISSFKEYQIALYTYSFSSFLDVMLVGNFSSAYLKGITQKLEEYSYQYRDLYTKSYNYLQAYSKSSVQPTLLRGLKKTSRFFDATINKVPLISDMPVATAFADAENKLDKFEANSSEQRLHELVGYQSAYVRPFIDNIEIICQLYDNPISLYFDKDAIYLGFADAKQTASVNC